MPTNGLAGSGSSGKSCVGSSYFLAFTGRSSGEGKIADDGVEQQLHALVAVGRAHEHRASGPAPARRRGRSSWISSSETGSSESSSSISSSLYIDRPSSMCWRALAASSFSSAGISSVADVLAVGAVEVDGLHRDQVDHALEVVFLADRPLHQHGVAAHLFADLGHDLLGVGAGAVHLVDERQPRHVIALHLAIDGQRLRLHAADAAQHQDRAVEHAQAALDLDGEVDVARACRSG